MSPSSERLTLASGEWAADHNSGFSSKVRGLQLFWDSTALGSFKICPRRYFYEHVVGWTSREVKIDLLFGSLIHGSLETFHHARSRSLEFEEALREAVLFALRSSWTDDKPIPMIDEQKNRMSLIRTVVWLLDRWKEDPLETLTLSDGSPAVELLFSFPIPLSSAVEDEQFYLCGRLDRLASLNGVPFVEDTKTTRRGLDSHFFSLFSPDNQFSLYTAASHIVWEIPTQGVILNGVQVGTSFSRFGRELISRSSSQVEEWLSDSLHWISSAEACARRESWPQNDKACGLFGGCPFRGVCSRSPEAREPWLETVFERRVWDPLAGGEI